MKRFRRSSIALSVAAVLALSGCATPGGMADTSDRQVSNQCNPLVGALVGGILGALIGGRNSGGAGAAIGAGVGALACVAVNAATRQTRTAEQVETDYRARNQGTLPAAPEVAGYDVTVAPSDSVKSGSQFQVVSSIEVVQGTQRSVNNVTERITLFRADNPSQELATLEKVATQRSASGAFENTFTFTLPQGVPQGTYPVQTVVYINGQVAAQKDSRVYVVAIHTGIITAEYHSR